MSHDATSSAGMSVLLDNQSRLNHAEFRLLFALSDCPAGDRFSMRISRLIDRHNFTRAEVVLASASLSAALDGHEFTVSHEADTIEWRLA